MSIRDFKQTLLMASLPCAAETHQQEARGRGGRLDQQRKPPKSRLRDQIASIERQAADLDCTPCGDSLPPLRCPVPLPPAPSTSASLSPHRRQTPGWNEPLKTVVRPPKRTRLSDYAAALVVGQPLPEGPYGQTQQRRERSGWDDGLEEEEEGEEEDRAVSAGGDSEAGLFIQSQNEGLQEPLILWPRDGGEGSSQGAGGLVQVPSSINGRLMEHQREGVKFLYRLYSENKGGVLGDDMGLGKTIQVIAFLAAVLQGDRLHPKIKNGDRGHKLSPNKKQVLIICPTSVLRNWEQEFHAWGAFEVAIYHGVHRELVLNRLECRNLQIVLTSFDTFRIHGDCLCAIDWDCMVVDEAHRLKNDKSNLYKVCTKIRTKRRYGLTGTIMQNKIMDLFNVFDWAAPGCLGSREHFREFYDEPLKQGQRISAPEKFIRIAEERRLHLAKVLQKCLLRREKHETIGHLMMGKEDNVIFCEMSPLQCRAYKRLLASPDFQCLTKKDEPCSCGSPLTFAECCYRTVPHGIIWPYLHRENPDGCDSCPYCLVLPCLTKLQQVSNHLELIKPNSKDDMEKQKKDELLAESVLAEDAGLVGGTTQDESFLGLSDTQHCGKMKALELMLAHWVQQGDKVLLFSYSVRMLDILDRFLIRKGYCFSRLDGSTAMSMRQSLVDDFNRSPSKQVFLISTRAGGLGLNLVSANRVVIFDPNWNPAQDLQAQDRSFRFGQRRHVTVYRLLAAGSLEELVYTRQIYKQQLFNIAVSGNLEKRYFEGVQDSKDNKGELFGISNLFRDLSEKAFTSEIIEKHDKRALSFCNSISKVGKIEERVVSEGRSEGSIAGAQDGGELTKSVECGLGFGNKAVLQKCCVKQRSEDKLTVVLRDAGVIYAHRNEDVVNYKSKTKPDGGAGRVALKNNQKSEFGLVRLPLTPNSSIAASKADNLRKEGNQHVKKIFKQINTLESKTVLSKEEQFASLAKFKGMDKTQFCKWLLSVSEAEKQNLLLDFKQRQKSFQLHSPSKYCGT